MHYFLDKNVFFPPIILLICLGVSSRKEILLLISQLNMPCHVFFCAESRGEASGNFFFFTLARFLNLTYEIIISCKVREKYNL